MMTQVLQSLANMFVDLLALTDQIFTALDGWGLVFGALTILTIYRLLLSPIVGGARVDLRSEMTRTKDRMRMNERAKQELAKEK